MELNGFDIAGVRPAAPGGRRRRATAVAAAIALAVVAAACGGSDADSDATATTGPVEAPANTEGWAVVVGSPDAPTTITLFEDPQCPVCAVFESFVSAPLATAVADGSARVEYRIVSFLDRASTNDYSSRAANALYAVASQAGPDAFVALHSVLYAQQPEEGGAGYTDEELINFAVVAGADRDAITPLINDKTFGPWIAEATAQMSVEGVRGTPGVFVDGTLIEGGPQQSIDAILAAIGAG